MTETISICLLSYFIDISTPLVLCPHIYKRFFFLFVKEEIKTKISNKIKH